ncbi:hypothetical protein K402DRAFT_330752 [Aulographum hederae CBS 113979]|uniref:CSN8/PSMD8/EIF3K domain-containing protein n=1 Tax=Aulographum hederae CBS 113979 TaxID=1176131 RepID=A0A6G1H233_9PEZI|nr:hypothetical protein K402DRAFT_330752 [Aulographum hederae CBS 113979]
MIQAQQRPSARRGASGAWSRLKSPQIDPLEVYGLPSKGETRLNDAKVQENFYNKIVERYMKFCAASGGGEELDKQFSSLSLSGPQKPSILSSKWAQNTPPHPHIETAKILHATRTLRESLTATRRADHFAQRAYIFLIHTALLFKSWENYLPALTHLLHVLHPLYPLPAPELREFVGYKVLDLACRVGDLGQAFAVRRKFGPNLGRVDAVLSALLHDNYALFFRLRRAVDGYQRALLSFAEDGIRLHALKCLGRGYMSAEKGFVERCTGRSWEELVKEGVGWELVVPEIGGDPLKEEKIIIRRVKRKSGG